jgi:hypothetical protein
VKVALQTPKKEGNSAIEPLHQNILITQLIKTTDYFGHNHPNYFTCEFLRHGNDIDADLGETVQLQNNPY